uniref:Uncharacterized protein n=1 Tax=Acrobeloides nanus TaxID=290746 RepID=A0A914E075_9BILA
MELKLLHMEEENASNATPIDKSTENDPMHHFLVHSLRPHNFLPQQQLNSGNQMPRYASNVLNHVWWPSDVAYNNDQFG